MGLSLTFGAENKCAVPALQCAVAGEGDHCRLGLHSISDTSPSSTDPAGQDRDTLSPI